MKTMKKLGASSLLALTAAAASVFLGGCATGDADHSHHAHGKPYPLKTCLVTGEGFEHGKPFVFVHAGQEIQLCCADCKNDFDKEPAKYLSKLGGGK